MSLDRPMRAKSQTRGRDSWRLCRKNVRGNPTVFFRNPETQKRLFSGLNRLIRERLTTEHWDIYRCSAPWGFPNRSSIKYAGKFVIHKPTVRAINYWVFNLSFFMTPSRIERDIFIPSMVHWTVVNKLEKPFSSFPRRESEVLYPVA